MRDNIMFLIAGLIVGISGTNLYSSRYRTDYPEKIDKITGGLPIL